MLETIILRNKSLFRNRLWEDILLEEERARLSKKNTEDNVKTDIYKYTYRRVYNDIDVPTTLLSMSGKGKIRNVVIKSKSNDIKINIMCDGRDIINETFDELDKNSDYTDLYNAFFDDSNNYYVFTVSDINFSSRASVKIFPISKNTTKVDSVEIVYDIETNKLITGDKI